MKKIALFLSLFLTTYPLLLIHAQENKKLVENNNAFAFDLYSQLKTNNTKNLFFSPFSISAALAMTYAGARTETERQMSKVLHFNLDQKNFHADFHKLLGGIEGDTANGLQLYLANSLWAQEKYNFSPAFFDLVKSNYHSELHKVNFAYTEKVRQEINTWVEQKTNSKIKDLIKTNVLDGGTTLVLVNAIYFNGKWAMEFDKKLTKEDTFHISRKEKVQTMFMHKRGDYSYYEDKEIKAIEIPYNDSIASMLVILPNEMKNLKTVEASLNSSYYEKISGSLQQKIVQLSLPKFKTTAEFELSGVLTGMGMPLAFSPKADFSGMRADSLKNLYIKNVIHKAFVDVSEEGTEAAAATAVVMGKAMVVSPSLIKTFKADHPFIFIIKDNATGSILFMGEIKNPNKE